MSTLSLPDLCCKNENLEDVRRALARGENVNKTDRDGRTGLMRAVEYNNNSIVELLLSQPGVDVNLVGSSGYTALHYACKFDNVEGLKMLLAHPDIKSHNVKDADGRTPFMWAQYGIQQSTPRCQYNNLNCIKELLKVERVDLDTG